MSARYRYVTIFLLVALAACASLLSTEPIKVDPVELKYIEAETQLKNTYGAMRQLAVAEKKARAGGAPAGSVVSRADYFTTLDRLDTFTTMLREGRGMTGTCLDVTKFGDQGLRGCLSREQIALVLLQILSQYNQGRL
ncbi:MAG: hypothetical protein U1E51_36310 [Candidatus Binatia bacterium]|nr:hypothetical protein [Candidatus Binatia bacterium]